MLQLKDKMNKKNIFFTTPKVFYKRHLELFKFEL